MATAGRYVVWFFKKLQDGSLKQEFAGIWNDRWLCVQQQLKTKMNTAEEGRIVIEGFHALDWATHEKVTRFSEELRWKLEDDRSVMS